MTIPNVAFDEVIEVSWGNKVADSLNNLQTLHQYIAWSPAGGDEYLAETAGVMSNWFTFGGASPITIDIPPWADRAYAHISIAGVRYEPTTAGRTSYLLQARFGTGLDTRLVRFSGQGGWFGLSWGLEIEHVDDIAGTRNVHIRAQRIEAGGATPGTGTDQWNLFNESDAAIFIIYTGAIE